MNLLYLAVVIKVTPIGYESLIICSSVAVMVMLFGMSFTVVNG